MASKLGPKEWPAGHGPNDFTCQGPRATHDGEFDQAKIADLGCFSQEDKDSNKYVHSAIVTSKKDGSIWLYNEWGRTGASSPAFQFTPCANMQEAQREFAAYCHSKNDKRGVWTTVAGIKTLTAKPGKDVYLVRDLAAGSTGLPDAKTIKGDTSSKTAAAPAAADSTATPVKKKAKSSSGERTVDHHTAALWRDLTGGTIEYARGSMADSSIPTLRSIEEGRQICQEAQKRLIVVGDDENDQVNDADLKAMTNTLYSRIPKKKVLHCAPRDWILNKSNIGMWLQDLDAFEAALSGQQTLAENKTETNPLAGLPFHLEYIEPTSKLGKFLHFWWPKATLNKHGGIGSMKIKNLWRVERFGDNDKFLGCQKEILDQKPDVHERPICQPNERPDMDDALNGKYRDSNTALLFHGTRSVNVTGILQSALRLPKQLVGVVITGAMFGPGIYWADDWKKSAGYTSMRGSYWSSGGGAVKGRQAFMFAADVCLGSPHVAPGPHGFTAPPKNRHCIFGMGRNHPTAKNRGSGVENNEWIIFDARQNQLRYLAEFETN